MSKQIKIKKHIRLRTKGVKSDLYKRNTSTKSQSGIISMNGNVLETINVTMTWYKEQINIKKF